MVKFWIEAEIARAGYTETVYATYNGIEGWHYTTLPAQAWLWNTWHDAEKARLTHYNGRTVARVVKLLLEVSWTNRRDTLKDNQGGGGKP